MPIQLAGRFLRRGNRAVGDKCPIDRAMQVVGTRSAVLLMREAYYGATRFDEFAARVGITESVAAKRLAELVGAGLLEKQAYKEPGQRTRFEYVVTDSGRDLMPAVFALGQWAAKHVPHQGTPTMTHADCGASAGVAFVCREGHRVKTDALVVTG